MILGFPAYLRHMALVARDEMGIDPRSLKVRLLGTHLGSEDRRPLEDLWGAPAFDMYGTHESGMLGAECRHQTGMHVMEDAFILEIADPETGRIVPDGEKGTVYITTLYKYGAPQIRFNVNDISAWHTAACPCGNTQRRLKAIYGRNDNMVKLRGVNVFPEAIGATRGGGRALQRRVLLLRRPRRRGEGRPDGRVGRSDRRRRSRGIPRRSRAPAEGSARSQGGGHTGRQGRTRPLHRDVAVVQGQAAARPRRG